MLVKVSTGASATITLLGIGIMVIPENMNFYIGIPVLVLGVLIGLWTLWGHLYFRRLAQLVTTRVRVEFLKADFQAIGMSSPYLDFYFNIHSCLSSRILVTGQRKGELWNPCVEAWRSNWEIDTNYQSIIKPDSDNELRIRWIVPQGHHSPMTEFAFRAEDKPPEQSLTFEDMNIELKARFLGFEGKIGWLQLSQGIVPLSVPDHPVFDNVRKEYLRQKNS